MTDNESFSIRDRAIELAKRYLPPSARNWVVRQQRRFHLQWPPVGTVGFGSFRRLSPISPVFALDRGFPIERYYIEQFLSDHQYDVHGRVLEMGDDLYTRKYGGDRLTKSDVLSVVASPKATIVADLTCADDIPAGTFDCIICTQTLQMIYDMRSAVNHLHRILKPGGVLLLTSHGISKVGRRVGRDGWGEYWHITSQSAEKLFTEVFGNSKVKIKSWGNVLTAMCALHGLASEELSPRELAHIDPDFEVIVTVRAVKG